MKDSVRPLLSSLKPLFILPALLIFISEGTLLALLPLKFGLIITGSLLLCLTLPFFLNREYLLLIILVVLIPFGILVVILEGGPSVLGLLGFIVFGVWAAGLALKKTPVIIISQFLYLFVWMIVMSFSALLSDNQAWCYAFVRSYLLVFILFFLVVNLVKTPVQIYQVGWALIVSLSIVALFLVLDQLVFINLNIHTLGYSDLHRQRLGLGTDPNASALDISVGIPFAIYYLTICRRGLQRVLLAICLLLLTSAIILTYSAGGLIGLLTTILLVLAFSKEVKTGHKIFLLVLSIVVICLAFSLTPAPFLERISFISHVIRQEDFAYWGSMRGAAWIGALNVILYNPVLGVGPGNVGFKSIRYYPLPQIYRELYSGGRFGVVPHNLFLAIASETGLIGFSLFIIVVITVLKGLYSSINSLRDSTDRSLLFIGQAILVSSIAFLAQGLAIDAQLDKYLWVLLGLAASFRLIVKQHPTLENLRRHEDTVGS